ncbi:MAG: TatD family hydrolase [Tannerella sp.]|jgi:TatD DNase family protein|nr:TatD family hydrolase [Tannerella sp.]
MEEILAGGLHIIDTHTHIYLEEFEADRTQVMESAMESGIIAMMLPNVDISTAQPLFRVCDRYPEFAFPMMGLHPTSVDSSYATQLNQIEKLLARRNFCAIGEIGIDLYWDQKFLKEQKEVFETQLQWSIDMQLPVSIHTRNAWPEVFECIHKVGKEALKGVFHCFSGTAEDLDEVKRLTNFCIGIDGNITYKNSLAVEIIRQMPVEKILLETDAPYLAPVPFRGKRNEPVHLWLTAKKLADIYQISLAEIATQTSQNALELFNIPMKSS